MDTESRHLRLSILAIVVASLFATLFVRLWYLQVLTPNSGAVAAANASRVRTVTEEAPRGRILDVKGRVLVDNRSSLVVTADTSQLDRMQQADRDDLVRRLAGELTQAGTPIKVAALERRLADPQYSPIKPKPVAIDVPEELEVYFAEHAEEFPGIDVHRETVRHYPEGPIAAHVVGYVGRISAEEYDKRMGTAEAPLDPPKPYEVDSTIGKSGIERELEDQLRGTPGECSLEVDVKGRVVRTLECVAPQPGNDVQLTLDLDIQKSAETALADQLEKARTRGGGRVKRPAGSTVVVEPSTGNVAALASYPTFDPSEFVNGISTERYAELTADAVTNPLINRVIAGQYAPGSTFKLITGFAALSKGMGNQSYYDNGSYTIPGCRGSTCTKTNAQNARYGSVDMSSAITVSSDVYFYWLGDRFWRERDTYGDGIQEAARLFGLGETSGIGLAGEQPGLVPTEDLKAQRHADNPEAFPDGTWREGDNVNIAIGQGDMLATPLQIANVYAAFANGGTLHQPKIVAAIIEPGGDPNNPDDVIERFAPVVNHQIDLPASIRDPLEKGLEGVARTSLRGTAGAVWEDWDLDAFPISSKTGTAEVKGQADNSLYVAYGPSNQPAYVVAAVLERAGFGADAAGPVVREVFETIVALPGDDATTPPEPDPVPTTPSSVPSATASTPPTTARRSTPTTRAPATTTTTSRPRTTTTSRAPAPTTSRAPTTTAGAGGP
jgi:penicillin-binding protein 2